MAKETIKASITIKAESIQQLIDALWRMADESGQIVQDATVSASIKLEANDASDLFDAINDVQRGVAMSDGVESQISMPGSAWDGKRAGGPTPMERYINQASGELFP